MYGGMCVCVCMAKIWLYQLHMRKVWRNNFLAFRIIMLITTLTRINIGINHNHTGPGEMIFQV